MKLENQPSLTLEEVKFLFLFFCKKMDFNEELRKFQGLIKY